MIEIGNGFPGHNKSKSSSKTTLLMAGRNSVDTENHTDNLRKAQQSEKKKNKNNRKKLPKIKLHPNAPRVIKKALDKIDYLYENRELIHHDYIDFIAHAPRIDKNGKKIESRNKRDDGFYNQCITLKILIATMNLVNDKPGKFETDFNEFRPYTTSQLSKWSGLKHETFMNHVRSMSNMYLALINQNSYRIPTGELRSKYANITLDHNIFRMLNLEYDFYEDKKIALEIHTRKEEKAEKKRAKLRIYRPKSLYIKQKEMLDRVGSTRSVYFEYAKNLDVKDIKISVPNLDPVQTIGSLKDKILSKPINSPANKPEFISSVLDLTNEIMLKMQISKSEAFEMAKQKIFNST